jgi:hypothetical protein
MHITPNWYADGQHILALGGGALIFGAQVVNFWRQNVAGQRITALHRAVTDNDKEILDELSTAQKSLDAVVATITSRERRKAPSSTPPPAWANGGLGRRASD